MWVLAVMTLSSPLSLSMQDNEQVSVDDRKELRHSGHKKVTCYCVVIVSICLFVCVLL